MDIDALLSLGEEYLAPVATPEEFTSRDIVTRAIGFEGPPRIPYSFVKPLASDFVELAGFTGGPTSVGNLAKDDMATDEWGVCWRGTGRQWGHPEVSPLSDLSALDGYAFPEVMTEKRIAVVQAVAEVGAANGKYVVGDDPIGNIERLRALMGFENLMTAPYTDRERFEALLDRLTDMTVDVVRCYGRTGNVHGFMTWEDWGLQNTLQIRPEQWREIYKPRYARIVKAAHDQGLHYIFHCCGYIVDIIGDMIEIGVDVLQLDQPRLLGVDKLADEFGGKICFWNTVDIQWSVSERVSDAELVAEVKQMVERLGCYDGGFMARQYPQPDDIGMPGEMHRIIHDAFMAHGCG